MIHHTAVNGTRWPVVIFLAACLATTVAVASEGTLGGELQVEDCELSIVIKDSEFQSSGDVKVVFQPNTIDWIFLETPLPLGFAIVREEDYTSIDLRIDQRVGCGFRKYNLSWGFPTSAWESVAEKVDGEFQRVRPGWYRFVVRYLPHMEFESEKVCVAVSEAFELTHELTLFVVDE